MLKTTTKTIKTLPKIKLKRRGEEIEMRAKRKNEMGGGGGGFYMPIFPSALPTKH